MLYPAALAEDEYIRMVLIRKDEQTIVIPKYVRTVDEFIAIAKRYRFTHDVYSQIATNRGIDDGTTDQQYRRKVLFLDFDLKDAPEIAELSDGKERVRAVLDRIQSKMPKLFVHCIVDSGHGYHCYISIEETDDITKIAEINKALVLLVGADVKAASPTQISRVPSTFNHKTADGGSQYIDAKVCNMVNVIFNKFESDDKFHPYKLPHIARLLSTAQAQQEKVEIYPIERTIWNYKDAEHLYDCLCTQRAYTDGVTQGQRNFFLGRIVQSFLLKGYNTAKILDLCREWNDRCDPPKPVSELESETLGWIRGINETQYNIGGCWWRFADGDSHREMLRQFCDKAYCQRRNGSEQNAQDGEHPIINSKAVSDKELKESNGSDYLLLTLIYVYQHSYGRKGFTFHDLRERLYSSVQGRYYLSKRTLVPLLLSMEQRNLIEISRTNIEHTDKIAEQDKLKLSRRMREYNSGAIPFRMDAVSALIDGRITKTDFRVYIALARNIQAGKSCTMDSLADALGMDRGEVCKHIRVLDSERLILTIKHDSEKGWEWSEYRIFF